MRTRHVLALTNDRWAADHVEQVARVDFASVQRRLRTLEGYGLVFEVSVDADEYDHWAESEDLDGTS